MVTRGDASTQTEEPVHAPGIYIINPLSVSIGGPLVPHSLPALPADDLPAVEYDPEYDHDYNHDYEDPDDPDYYPWQEDEPPRKRAKDSGGGGKVVEVTYSEHDKEYFNGLSKSRQKKITKQEKLIQDINCSAIPLRFKILESNMEDRVKAYAIKRINQMYSMDPSSGEYNKMSTFLDALSRIPIGKYMPLACTKDSPVKDISRFLEKTRAGLDSAVFGHEECKEQIIRLLAQWISNPKSSGLVIGIEGPMGCGKCHARDTPILMHDGSIKMVQDIEVGDVLMGDDSTRRVVQALGRGWDIMYTIVYPDGHSYTVNSEHILCLVPVKQHVVRENTVRGNSVMYYDFVGRQPYQYTFGTSEEARAWAPPSHRQGHVVEMSVKEYIHLPAWVQGMLVGYRAPVERFGGYSTQCTLQEGYDAGWGLDVHSAAVRGTTGVRRRYMAGVLDRCGQVLGGRYCAFVPTRSARDTIVFVARSLGMGVKTSSSVRPRTVRGLHIGPWHHRVEVWGGPPIPVSHLRPPRFLEKDPLLQPIRVQESGVGQYYGFTLDGNHRYMMGDFTVTHNTTLVKDGICKALGLPFGFVPLGGVSDGSYLLGHSYTYEGARWGRIVEILMNTGCMNPIFFFDELDKVSDTRYGEEIKNILIHLTDSSQNTDFHDKYFCDLPLDLSRCLVVFSYNNGEYINPILKDRMVTIKTGGYTSSNKVEIVERYMLKELLEKYGFRDNDVVFGREVIAKIISRTKEEKGVRNLKRSLEDIISRLNLDRLLERQVFPYVVVEDDVEAIRAEPRCNDSIPMMYT